MGGYSRYSLDVLGPKGSGKPKALAKQVFFGGFPTGTRTKGRTLQFLLARALRSVRYIPCRPEERLVQHTGLSSHPCNA